MAEQDLDRNHAATPYKLEKARERGQAPKSLDVISAVVFTSAMVFVSWRGWPALRELLSLDRALLGQAGRVAPTPGAMWSLVERTITDTLSVAAPFFLVLLVAGFAGNVVQTGPILSAHPLKPDWTRVNPVTGLKRLLSARTLFHGARAVLKLAILAAVVWFALRRLQPRAFELAHLPMGAIARALVEEFAGLGLRIAGVLALLAVLDLAYTRHEFSKQMRMSRRELKDEVKNREGDPRVRARLAEIRREMLKKILAIRRTRTADAVVTNPTHYAVALRYVHGEMAAPELVAKGAGPLAAAMRAIAARHGIPVVRNPSLARALYREVPLSGGVPPEHYAQVARIVAWVFAMRAARQGRGGDLRLVGAAGGAA